MSAENKINGRPPKVFFRRKETFVRASLQTLPFFWNKHSSFVPHFK